MTVIDLSIAKRRYSSTCGIHQRMPRPSPVRLAIHPSATKRLWSSTCGILAFTNRIQKPLLDVFFRSFPTSDYDPSLLPATSYANLREHDIGIEPLPQRCKQCEVWVRCSRL